MSDYQSRKRLTERFSQYGTVPSPASGGYRRGEIVTAGDAVQAVSLALWSRDYAHTREDYTAEQVAGELARYPEPTRDDVLDALVNVVDYRRAVDGDELRLIDAARALGVEWDEIGEALGYPARSAKQSARARRSGLMKPSRDRWPRRRPLVTEAVELPDGDVEVPARQCPHGCGPLDAADDAMLICPKCGDEWAVETIDSPAVGGGA